MKQGDRHSGGSMILKRRAKIFLRERQGGGFFFGGGADEGANFDIFYVRLRAFLVKNWLSLLRR
jgi:hypothetical protein